MKKRLPNPLLLHRIKEYSFRRRKHLPVIQGRGTFAFLWLDRRGRRSKFKKGKFLYGYLYKVSKRKKIAKQTQATRDIKSVQGKLQRMAGGAKRIKTEIRDARKRLAKRPTKATTQQPEEAYSKSNRKIVLSIRRLHDVRLASLVNEMRRSQRTAEEIIARHLQSFPLDSRYSAYHKYQDKLSAYDELVTELEWELNALANELKTAEMDISYVPSDLWQDTDKYMKPNLIKWGIHPDAWEVEKEKIASAMSKGSTYYRVSKDAHGRRILDRKGNVKMTKKIRTADAAFRIPFIYFGPTHDRDTGDPIPPEDRIRFMFHKKLPERQFTNWKTTTFYIWVVFQVPPRLSPYIAMGKLKTPRVTSMMPKELGKAMATTQGETRGIIGYRFTYKPSISGRTAAGTTVLAQFNPLQFYEWINGVSKESQDRANALPFTDPKHTAVDLPHVRTGARMWQTIALREIGSRLPEFARSAQRDGSIKALHLLGFTGEFMVQHGRGIVSGEDYDEDGEEIDEQAGEKDN